jgi:hypothetical protein
VNPLPCVRTLLVPQQRRATGQQAGADRHRQQPTNTNRFIKEPKRGVVGVARGGDDAGPRRLTGVRGAPINNDTVYGMPLTRKQRPRTSEARPAAACSR